MILKINSIYSNNYLFNVLKNRRYNNEHNGNEFDGTAKSK